MEIKTPLQHEDTNVQTSADGLLLKQFVNEGNQDAFAALMKRHESYVLSVCRHLTSNVQDAEDIFQACFLELVRKAGSIRQHDCVAGWLQTVAVRLAHKTSAKQSQRRQKEAQAVRPSTDASSDDISWREACRILEEEIAQLPEDLRLPIILCLFRELSQEEAAQELGIAVRHRQGTLAPGPRGAASSTRPSWRHVDRAEHASFSWEPSGGDSGGLAPGHVARRRCRNEQGALGWRGCARGHRLGRLPVAVKRAQNRLWRSPSLQMALAAGNTVQAASKAEVHHALRVDLLDGPDIGGIVGAVET